MNPRLQSLAEQFARDHDHQKLVDGLEQMVARGEGFHMVYVQLGNAYGYLGRNEESVAAFEQAIALDPDVYILQFMYGSALATLDRHEEAIEAYKKAAALDPSRSEPLVNAGNSTLILGDPEKAIQLHLEALARNPNDTVAQRALEGARQYQALSPEERTQIRIVLRGEKL